MDTSARRIVITEDNDFDLDKLLLGDNSGAESSPPPPPSSLPPPSPPTKVATPPPTAAQCLDAQKSPASSPLLAAQGEKVGEDEVVARAEKVDEVVARAEPADEGDFDEWILPASAQPGDYIARSPEVPSRSILKKLSPDGTALDDGAGHWVLPASAQPGDYMKDSPQDKVPSKSILKKSATATAILAQEEEGGDLGLGHWSLPEPAKPGDYLNNSLHKVPSKSILKKTSSYNCHQNCDSSNGKMSKKASFQSFFTMDSSSRSQASPGRDAHSQQPANLNASLSGGMAETVAKSSFLNLDTSSSNLSQGSQVGYDLDAPSPSYSNNFASPNKLDAPANDAPLPPLPNLKSNVDIDTAGADRAAGFDSSSGTRHSENSSGKMRRNVSFHSVDVREYDRTVGDNPSCRSGPPLSLDWSYSKKYQRNFEEFERERSSDRARHIRHLHVNKHKRRTLLAFQWGHTEEELREARRNTRKMQRQRSVTKMMLPVQSFEEAFVSFKSFIKRKTKKGGGTDDNEDWSDISNSGSSRGSHRRYQTSSRSLPPSTDTA